MSSGARASLRWKTGVLANKPAGDVLQHAGGTSLACFWACACFASSWPGIASMQGKASMGASCCSSFLHHCSCCQHAIAIVTSSGFGDPLEVAAYLQPAPRAALKAFIKKLALWEGENAPMGSLFL